MRVPPLAAAFCCFALMPLPFFPARAEAQVGQPKLVNLRGTVLSVGRGSLMMKTTAGAEWNVDLHPEKQQLQVNGGGPAALHVRGTWSREQIRTGMNVRFTAAAPVRGVLQEPISELTWFTPTPEAQSGVHPEGEGVFVVGAVSNVRGDNITIAFPGGTVRGRLAPDALLKLDLNDIAPVKPGDEISVAGYYLTEPAAIGQTIEITVATQLPKTAPATGRGGRETERPESPLAEDPFALPDPEEEAALQAAAREAVRENPVGEPAARPIGERPAAEARRGRRGTVIEVN